MLSLLWPWVFVLIPIPILYRYWRKPMQLKMSAIRAPSLLALAKTQSSHTTGSRWIQQLLKLLLWLCWLCVLLALSRPIWVGDPVALPTNGRDLLLAVDISPSMRQRDMRIGGQTMNRLMAVKAGVGEVLEKIAQYGFYQKNKENTFVDQINGRFVGKFFLQNIVCAHTDGHDR